MTSATAHRFRRLADHFTTIVDAVPTNRWASPSPCDGWTATDVVEHVVNTQLDHLRRQPFGQDVDIDTSDPVAALPLVSTEMQDALDDPERADHAYDGFFGPTTFAATIDDFYSPDLVVHAWDLATAAGLNDLRRIDPDEMTRIRAGLEAIEDTMRQPGLFGPALVVPDDADDQVRFLAFVGRTAAGDAVAGD